MIDIQYLDKAGHDAARASSTRTPADYFIGNEYYGRSMVPNQQPYAADSIAMFCPCCGEVWGRIVVEGRPYWRVVTRACRKHTPTSALDWGAVPGSMLSQNLDPAFSVNAYSPMALEKAPEALLKYELELSLQWTGIPTTDGVPAPIQL